MLEKRQGKEYWRAGDGQNRRDDKTPWGVSRASEACSKDDGLSCCIRCNDNLKTSQRSCVMMNRLFVWNLPA